MDVELEFEETRKEAGCGCGSSSKDEIELAHSDICTVTEWWTALQHEQPQKEFLRRCRRIDDAAESPAAYILVKELRQHEKVAVLALAMLLAHVDVNEMETKFICRLGTPSSRPAFSEVHFSRLRYTKTLEELIPRFRRAILLLGRSVQIASLTECVLTWSDAHLPEYNAKPERAKKLAEKWVAEYESSRRL